MKPSVTEKEALRALRYYQKLRRDKARRLQKAYMKFEKLQPRSFHIAILLDEVGRAIEMLKVTHTLDWHLTQDAENLQYLRGKPVKDKTAGRNTLGLSFGK